MSVIIQNVNIRIRSIIICKQYVNDRGYYLQFRLIWFGGHDIDSLNFL